MLSLVPLLIIPFILFNLGLAGLFGSGTGDPFATQMFSVQMMSGGIWTMTVGDLLIVVALLLLFVEMMKSTRTSNASIVDPCCRPSSSSPSWSSSCWSGVRRTPSSSR